MSRSRTLPIPVTAFIASVAFASLFFTEPFLVGAPAELPPQHVTARQFSSPSRDMGPPEVDVPIFDDAWFDTVVEGLQNEERGNHSRCAYRVRRTLNEMSDSQRDELTERLIVLVDPQNASANCADTRNVAAFLLGELSADRAIPVLVASLRNPPFSDNWFSTYRFERGVFKALVKIGAPCVPALIEVLRTTDKVEYRENSLTLLWQILTYDEATLLLAKVSYEEADPLAAERLRVCEECLQGWLSLAREHERRRR